jgi:hypothetical protein
MFHPKIFGFLHDLAAGEFQVLAINPRVQIKGKQRRKTEETFVSQTKRSFPNEKLSVLMITISWNRCWFRNETKMEIEKEHNNVDIMQLAIAVGSLYG